jgi:hypothetical protein
MGRRIISASAMKAPNPFPSIDSLSPDRRLCSRFVQQAETLASQPKFKCELVHIRQP